MTVDTREAPASESPETDASRSRLRSIDFGAVLMEGRALLALLLIIAVFAAMSDNYLTTGNLVTITKQVAFNALLALGMLLVVLNAGIDLSVGSTVGLTCAVSCNLFRGLDLPLNAAIMYLTLWLAVILP